MNPVPIKPGPIKPGPGSRSPIGGIAAAAAGRRRDLYLLSGDDGLLLELGPLLGDRYRSRPIDSADQLSQAGPAPWLLLIDATARSDARAQAARIEQQHPQAPLIVICADGRSAEWANAIARGNVSAVIERGSLQTALLDALQAAELRLNPASGASPRPAAATLAGPGPGSPRRSPWLWLVPAALLVAGGGWLALRDQVIRPTAGPVAAHPEQAGDEAASATAEPQAAVAANPAAAAAPARSVLELLSDARIAFRDQKNLLPRADAAGHGDSALELYAAVLAQDPQNDEARDGLRRLFSVARARIQSDLTAGRLDEATRLLAAFHDVGVNNEATGKIEADIAAARPKWLVAQARTALAAGDTATAEPLIAQIAAGGGDHAVLAELRRTLDARTAEAQLTELAARTRAAIAAGALLEPANDNARAHLTAMQQLNRNLALTATVQHELMNALIARAQNAGRAGQLDIEQQYLNAAGEYGTTNELSAARRQLQTALDAARDKAAAAAAPAHEPQPVSTVPRAAAAALPADYIAARPVQALNASYPPQALEAHQSGYVIVEFMLNARGRAGDPHVIESSPPGVFDHAAVEAVRSSRFDTAKLAPGGTSQRARVRLTFKP